MRKLALVVRRPAGRCRHGGQPGGAITYGEPDAGEHPYVGFMIFFVPTEPGLVQLLRARCSTPTRS